VADDVTDILHPSIAHAAALAARVVGLDIAGIDLVAEDITRPLDEQRGAIIEVNSSPGLLAHIKPATGQARPVGAAIVEHLFGDGEDGRIPVVGVTGTLGTSLIARLVGCLLHLTGKQVGVVNGEGLYLGARQVKAGDCMNFEAGQRLLINRTVQAAVFESNARMILTEGLAYDKCAVGVVTDVSDFEELSEFYIDSADKLYGVLRTQVDVILPSGVAVLNAADPQVVDMADLCDGEVIFYGVDEHLAAVAQHRQDGKRVVFQRQDKDMSRIVLAQGYDEAASLPLSPLVPPEAVLAAIAAGWALGLTPELIGAGLRTFDANPKRTHH
jgi:cyanophycin synthetase